MVHLNTELCKIHQLCVFQVLNAEEANPTRKEAYNWLRQNCHDIILECHDITSIEPVEAMLQ